MGPECIQPFDGLGCLLFRDSAFGLKFHRHRPAEVAPDRGHCADFFDDARLWGQRLAKRLVGELQCAVILDGQLDGNQPRLGAERFQSRSQI